MESKISETQTYSWGEFYETTKACENYEEIKKKFKIFERLDKAKTWNEIESILVQVAHKKNRINWLNSPCLDGLIYLYNSHISNEYGILEKLCSSKKDYVETFKFLLGKNVTIPVNLLEIVCRCGLLEIAKVVLTLGKFKNVNEIYIKTPLEWSCLEGHTKIVNLLLEKGAIVEIGCLIVAIQLGHTELVQILLEHGANLHFDNGKPLLEACERGHTNIVKLLLEKGAKILPVHYHTMDPLFVAAREGYAEVMKLLLQYGAVMTDDILGVAFYNSKPEAVRVCLEHGANAESLFENNYRAKMLDSARIVFENLGLIQKEE